MTAPNTLEELEGFLWGEPTYDSCLVKTCYQLRKKPIDQYCVEDFRIMIGQRIGLLYLIPPALDILRNNPLAEGHFGPGDLLKAMQGVPKDFWDKHSDLFSLWEKIKTK